MQIFGIKITKINHTSLLQKLQKNTEQKIVFTPNPEILLKAKYDKEFHGFLSQADYLTSDGIGLYLAYQILDNSHGKWMNIILIPVFIFNIFFRRKKLYSQYGERICGSDLTKNLLEYAQTEGKTISIIDLYVPQDLPKVASQKEFPTLLQKAFPKLQFFYYIYKPDQKEQIIQEIANSKSEILFSTLGMKKQEQSILEVLEKAKNIRIGLGVGSSFDYFIGFQKRAPSFIRMIGIEWLYRLCTGPKKLQRLRRIYHATFGFIGEVLKEK